jgi:ABC-2 type transport system permease protein
VLIDGSDPNVGTIVRNLVGPIVQKSVLDVIGMEPPKLVTVLPRVLYNPEQKSAFFFVPGLIAIILIMISAMLTSLTLTKEKETGTLEELLISPLRPWEIIMGKITPYVFLAAADFALILVVGRFNFGVTVTGSIALLALASVIYIITSLSLGIIFSTFAKNRQQAMMMVLPATMLPTIVLSGFIFPIASMPWPLRLLSQIIPATYFLTISRGIILKGVGFAVLWKPMAIMLGIGLFFIMVSIKKFKVRL